MPKLLGLGNIFFKPAAGGAKKVIPHAAKRAKATHAALGLYPQNLYALLGRGNGSQRPGRAKAGNQYLGL